MNTKANLEKKYGVLNSSKIGTKLTILSTESAQDSEFCLFFGRIQDAMICFRHLLTFKGKEFQPEMHREMVE